MKKVLSDICVARTIATHLVGHDHKFWHRGLIGICFMLVGVLIAKEAAACEYHVLALLGDTVGYDLHGVGLVPFIEALLAEV